MIEELTSVDCEHLPTVFFGKIRRLTSVPKYSHDQSCSEDTDVPETTADRVTETFLNDYSDGHEIADLALRDKKTRAAYLAIPPGRFDVQLFAIAYGWPKRTADRKKLFRRLYAELEPKSRAVAPDATLIKEMDVIAKEIKLKRRRWVVWETFPKFACDAAATASVLVPADLLPKMKKRPVAALLVKILRYPKASGEAPAQTIISVSDDDKKEIAKIFDDKAVALWIEKKGFAKKRDKILHKLNNEADPRNAMDLVQELLRQCIGPADIAFDDSELSDCD